MSDIKKIPFKEVDFDSLNEQNISFDWQQGDYYFIVWKHRVGESNNEILFQFFLPKSLSWAIAGYIQGNFKSTRTYSDL